MQADKLEALIRSTKIEGQISELETLRDRVEQEIAILVASRGVGMTSVENSLDSFTTPILENGSGVRIKRTLSPNHKKNIGSTMKQRWAEKSIQSPDSATIQDEGQQVNGHDSGQGLDGIHSVAELLNKFN